MRIDWTTLQTLAVAGLLAGSVANGHQSVAMPIAGLISELSGTASLSANRGAKSPARRFDAVADGTTLVTGTKSRVVLVLSGGQRFELGANARAVVGARGLSSTSGPIAKLSSLPPLPRLTALDETGPKGPAGGIRLRAPEISNLYPSAGATLADDTTVRFTPVNGASRYGVEIENAAGDRIFSAESTTPELRVPPGVLAPATRYYWTVRTLDKVGAAARGEAAFRTISSEDAGTRQALRKALGADEHGDGLALLAEVDRRLGLYAEALEGFRAALARRADDPALQNVIRRLENLLKGGGAASSAAGS